jgi:hypothetical protein
MTLVSGFGCLEDREDDSWGIHWIARGGPNVNAGLNFGGTAYADLRDRLGTFG